MSRQKKSRRITDIMPQRKSDKKPEATPRPGKKPTRYELDAKAREEKRKRKHKGLASGSRHSSADTQEKHPSDRLQDPRVGSRKKVPLIVEFVNKPAQNQAIPPLKTEQKPTALDPINELEQLENNECLNRLLDDLEAGKKLNKEDQKFVDECLDRIAQLMNELGIASDDENDDDLYRTFEKIDINQFR